jgi:DNA-directed RNA polymerase alpha subunit
MAILVSGGDKPSYLVFTHKEYRSGLAYEIDGQKLRVRVPMGSSASGDAALKRLTIEELTLTNRSYKSLKKDGIKFAWQLVMMSEAEIMRIPGIGAMSFEDIEDALYEVGFSRPIFGRLS